MFCLDSLRFKALVAAFPTFCPPADDDEKDDVLLSPTSLPLNRFFPLVTRIPERRLCKRLTLPFGLPAAASVEAPCAAP
jgi:hypothetical protein